MLHSEPSRTSVTPDLGSHPILEPKAVERDEVGSLFAFANMLLRHKRAILIGMLVGAVIGVAIRAAKPAAYTSTVSFMPQGAADVPRSGMAALAGQFGIGLGGGDGMQSTKFYTDLFQSFDFLVPITREQLTVVEQGGRQKTLADLYEVKETSPAVRDEAVVALLSGLITSTTDSKTGTVTFSVTTKWPSVSYAIAQRLVARVNDYNLHVRQSQAAAERRFIGERLAIARDSLTAAEGRLRSFLQNNREWSKSPDLTFYHGQTERAILAAEQLVVNLTQAYEDARIREVRDTPVITVIEPPRVPFGPQRRRLISRGILGLLVGAMVVAIGVLVREFFHGRRRKADPDVEEFLALLKPRTLGSRKSSTDTR